MAFPTTSLLDSFAGADEDPITTNWTTPLIAGEADAGIFSHTVFTRGSKLYYDLATYGTDCEAWCTLTTRPRDGFGPAFLFARITSPNTIGQTDGYGGGVYLETGTWRTRIVRIDNDAFTNLVVGNTAPTFADGDGLGLEIIGSTITLYRRAGAGPWSSIESTTDATYLGAGYIGMGCDDSAAFLDDFGGGTVGGVPSPPTLRTVTSPLRW